MLFKLKETYQPVKDDTLKAIAITKGVSWQDIALMNWGTQDDEEVYDMLRHYLKIDPKKEKPVCAGSEFKFEGDETGGPVKIPEPWTEVGFEREKRHNIRTSPFEAKPYLRITEIDKHFAPGHELLAFKYRMGHLDGKKVELKVKSEHYGDKVIFSRELTAPEIAKGSDKQISKEYKGETTIKNGPFSGDKIFLNPLYSPYKLILEAECGILDEVEFKVLYAEMELEQAKWTADEKEPDKSSDLNGWLRWQLNELGYFGGPFTSDAGLQTDFLNRAIKFYKASDCEFQKRQYKDDTLTTLIAGYPNADSIYDGLNEDPSQFSSLIEQRLKKKKNKRDYIEFNNDPVADEGGNGKYIIQQILYQKDSQFFSTAASSKSNQDEVRLNFPVLPIRAKIKIKDKSDKPQYVPGAVGKANVAWRVEDPAEENMAARYQTGAARDTQRLPYMQAVQQFISDEAFQFSDTTPMVKNCPECCGGKQKLAELFCDHTSGDGVELHKLTIRNGLACSLAGIDPTKEKSFGRTSINFLPSNMAGDSYRVIADLDFDDPSLGFTTDHIKQLKKDNGANLPGVVSPLKEGRDACKVKTGIITIRRSVDFSRIVKWPSTTGYASELPRLSQNFDQCYIDMKVPGGGEQVSINKVISNGDYQKVVRTAFAPDSDEIEVDAGITEDEADTFSEHATPGKKLYFWRKFNLKKDYLYGRDLPPQKTLTGVEYKLAVKSLMYGDSGFVGAMAEKMSYLVATKLRPKVATGHISIAFKTHKSFEVIDDPSLPKKQRTKTVVDHCGGYSSMGNADGVVFYDLADPDRDAYVTAHEFGHHQFLYHHWVAGSDDETLHDTSDNNCIMSYTDDPTRVEGVFDPLFCGKCNLRLRGWDVSAPHPQFPAGS